MRRTVPLHVLVLGVLAAACNDSSSPLGPTGSPETRNDSLAADSARMVGRRAGLDGQSSLVAWKASFPRNSLTPVAPGACPESAMPRVFPADTADLRPTASPVVALVLGPRPRLKLPGLLSDRCTVDLRMLAHP